MIGECGCNETMVEQVVVGLADVLPAGDKGETGRPGKPDLTGNSASKYVRLLNPTIFMI